MTDTTLFKHQQDFVDANPDKRALVWGTGTGKTRTSIEWARKGDSRTLIICPKTLKTNWSRELVRWGLMNGAEVMTKEEFRRDWRKLGPFGQVIVDEAHYFLNAKSQMSKALRGYIKKYSIERILALTATPYMSTPLNIMTLGNILGHTDYHWSYPYFMHEFFFQLRMGSRIVPKVKKGIEPQLAKKVAQIADVVRLEDCKDVPDEIFETEYVALTPEQEQAMEEVDDVNYIVRWTKRHQISNGTLNGDAYTDTQIFPSEKRERLMTIIEETPKVVVVCRYNAEIETLRDTISKLKGGPDVFVINGAVKDRQDVLDKANASKRAVLIVNAMTTEGWEASSFNTMVFYTLDFSLKNYIQAKGRIQRINAIQKCRYVFLVTEGSIDEDVYRSVIENKQSFHLKIYNDQHQS